MPQVYLTVGLLYVIGWIIDGCSYVWNKVTDPAFYTQIRETAKTVGRKAISLGKRMGTVIGQFGGKCIQLLKPCLDAIWAYIPRWEWNEQAYDRLVSMESLEWDKLELTDFELTIVILACFLLKEISFAMNPFLLSIYLSSDRFFLSGNIILQL